MKPKAAIPDDLELPEKFTSLRAHQIDAIDEIMVLFGFGTKVVFLDAPVGAGKTLIAEVVRQRLEAKTVYMCSTLSLQDQFLDDFDYAHVLKGRSNYQPTDPAYPYATCEDCDREKITDDEYDCSHCFDTELCPYRSAKNAAEKADLAVVNTAYYLSETQNVDASVFRDRDLAVIDECDLLESAMQGQVEFVITKQMEKDLRLICPPKGAHKTTIQTWITESLIPIVKGRIKRLQGDDATTAKLKRKYIRILAQAGQIDLTANDYWVRDNSGYNPLVMKPYRVHLWGQKRIWATAKNWLCMSGTIISPDEMADALGLEDHEWDVVHVPMTFPAKNRPIYYVGCGQMTYKHKDKTLPVLANAINHIAFMSEGKNILVHAHSYNLCEALMELVTSPHHDVHSYTSAKDREKTISLFDQAHANVLVIAPSLNRGIDLDGDKCEVQIIAKIPYANLKDPLVSARLKDDEGMGDLWYQSETTRAIVQATGRAIRSPTDVATTFILDSSYTTFLGRGGRELLPEWWLETVKTIPLRKVRGHELEF